MQTDPIDELQELVTALCSRSGRKTLLPVHRRSIGDGTPHVDARADGFDIVCCERGMEMERVSGLTRLEAARWFLFRAASSAAQEEELRGRKASKPTWLRKPEDGYSRCNWMVPCIAVMAEIAPDFGPWAAQHFAEALATSPLTESERRNARFPLPMSDR